MTAIHQMGHHSNNIVVDKNLTGFKGVIFSPVNYLKPEIINQNQIYKRNSMFTIFDPQLYYPKTQMEKLLGWDYFPHDVDTADYSDMKWWSILNEKLVVSMREITPSVICSPITLPRIFNDDFYDASVRIANDLITKMGDISSIVYQTLLLNLNELAVNEKPFSISSIISKTKAKNIYLVIYSHLRPRQELYEPEELKGVMKLIRMLKENDLNVTVSNCSSDLLLWKVAGAIDCATGKFFNLRRFTPSRWIDNDTGGGQLPYLIEESLLAFLRESDIKRIQKIGLISEISRQNIYFSEILSKMENGNAWLALSWKFYLYWFQEIERKLSNDPNLAQSILLNADKNWTEIDRQQVILEERQNNGGWIRQWLRAVNEYGL